MNNFESYIFIGFLFDNISAWLFVRAIYIIAQLIFQRDKQSETRQEDVGKSICLIITSITMVIINIMLLKTFSKTQGFFDTGLTGEDMFPLHLIPSCIFIGMFSGYSFLTGVIDYIKEKAGIEFLLASFAAITFLSVIVASYSFVIPAYEVVHALFPFACGFVLGLTLHTTKVVGF